MPDRFDPYHRWLGISPKDQPPTHYRLLGIDEYENDPDVIEHAADQRMVYVRTFQTGEHSVLSQKLLNEIGAARVCLLDPAKKAQYDQSLRSKTSPAVPVATAVPVLPSVAPVRETSPAHRTLRRKKQTWHAPAAIGVAILVVVGAVVALEMTGREKPVKPSTATASPQPKPASPALPPVLNKSRRPASSPKDRPRPEFAAEPDREPQSQIQQPLADESSTGDALNTSTMTPIPDWQVAPDGPTEALEFQEHTYRFIEARGISWAEARQACEKIGGQLACIDTGEELEFIGNLKGAVSTVVWVGGHRDANGPLLWLNGRPVTFAGGGRPTIYGAERPASEEFFFLSVVKDGIFVCRPGNGAGMPSMGGTLAQDVDGYVCEWDSEATREPSPNPHRTVAIPSESDVAKAIDTIHEVYAAQYAAEDKEPLVERLLAQARESGKDPASQFALLSEARDVATAAGDCDSAFEAIGELENAFDVDSLAMKVDVLRSAVSDDRRRTSVVTKGLVTIKEAAERGDKETVKEVGRIVLAAVRHLRNPEYVRKIGVFNKSMEQWAAFVTRCKQGVETLEDAPDDPTANGWAGKYYCLVQGSWDKGLPLLEKGAPDAMRVVALQDLKNPPDPAARISLADAWWELQKQIDGVAAERLRTRAAYWYGLAKADAVGAPKGKIEARLKEIEDATKDIFALAPNEVTDNHMRTLLVSKKWFRIAFVNGIVKKSADTIFVFNADGSCQGNMFNEHRMSAWNGWSVKDKTLIFFKDGREEIRCSFDPEQEQFSGALLADPTSSFAMRPMDQ